MRPFYLLLPFVAGAGLVIWVGLDSLPLAFWNLCPLALAHVAIVRGAERRGVSRWAHVVFGVTSALMTVLFHFTWLVDWRGTASGSSTAGIGFLFIPIYSVVVGLGCSLALLVIAHAIRLLRL